MFPNQQFPPNVGFNNLTPQSFSNTMNMQGSPAMRNPQVPGQGYPLPAQSAYPQPGYPIQQNQGYPQSTAQYPTQGVPYPTHQNQGYPQSTAQYPTQGVPYPNHQSQGYPQSTAQYPTQGFPQHAQSAYPQSSQPQTDHGFRSQPGSIYGNQSHPPNQFGINQSRPVPVVPKSRPTVFPVNPFNPREDAGVLRKAMKGFGTDEKSIIQVLTKRSNEQRLRIALEFKTLYGKDLISDIKSETSGKFEDLLIALLTPLPKFYAKELHEAMVGIGTDEGVLIEVMCTMSNYEIHSIKQAYTAIYGKILEDDIRGDTSGNFNRLMTSLCVGNRSEDFTVDQNRARDDARKLLQAGELRMGTDESTFNMILCSRSYPQLAAIFQEYEYLTGHEIEHAIKSEFSGDIEKALLTIVKVVRNKPLYFAERLHKSMKGLGTNDKQLIRIMVTRCEVDLGDIVEAFQTKYGETLQSWIEGDCSGHYKKCLLGLLGAY
ncbi:annexin B9-like isoform X1 [Bombyx mandarina]|uniref:Annexin n=1 Tax=Bombyx mandarina TaxID=7092 RepID=A0A6J2JMY4_BOMMA|nr:annexin B9-like isoform X1 [Bombyx mandarina]